MLNDRPYWDERMLDEDNARPAVLAVGDSWFWYPIFRNLLDPINLDVWDRRYTIFAIGANGAEMREFVDGRLRGPVRDALKGWGQGLSIVMVSGGGNDFAGWMDLKRLLKLDCSGATSAQECFEQSRIDGFFNDIERYYVAFIYMVREWCQPNIKVVVHNYDYAVPDGRGVFRDERWLKAPMEDRRVPAELMQPCVNYLIDRFTVIMQALEQTNSMVRFVASAGCLKKNEWANELHPKPAGFTKLAVERWAPVLLDILPR
jgi:hypothetical protein